MCVCDGGNHIAVFFLAISGDDGAEEPLPMRFALLFIGTAVLTTRFHTSVWRQRSGSRKSPKKKKERKKNHKTFDDLPLIFHGRSETDFFVESDRPGGLKEKDWVEDEEDERRKSSASGKVEFQRQHFIRNGGGGGGPLGGPFFSHCVTCEGAAATTRHTRRAQEEENKVFFFFFFFFFFFSSRLRNVFSVLQPKEEEETLGCRVPVDPPATKKKKKEKKKKKKRTRNEEKCRPMLAVEE